MQLCLDSHIELLTSSNNCGSSCQHGTSASDLRVWPLIYREIESVTQHYGGWYTCCGSLSHLARFVLSSGRAGM